MDFTLVFFLLLLLVSFLTLFLRIIFVVRFLVIQYSDIEFIINGGSYFLFLYISSLRTFTCTNIWLPPRPSEVPEDTLPKAFALLLWNVTERVVFIFFHVEILHRIVNRPW